MTPITDAGLALGESLIRRFEGVRLRAYQDTRGLWTIGVGNRTLLDGTPVTASTPDLTEDEADALLVKTLYDKVLPTLAAKLTRELSDHQGAALLSLVWNIGNGAFATSTVEHDINAGQMQMAGAHFLDWCHSGGRFFAPLYARRAAERAVWNTGDVSLVPHAPAAVVVRAAVTADSLNAGEISSLQQGAGV